VGDATDGVRHVGHDLGLRRLDVRESEAILQKLAHESDRSLGLIPFALASRVEVLPERGGDTEAAADLLLEVDSRRQLIVSRRLLVRLGLGDLTDMLDREEAPFDLDGWVIV
jgi:hypothetical protein